MQLHGWPHFACAQSVGTSRSSISLLRRLFGAPHDHTTARTNRGRPHLLGAVRRRHAPSSIASPLAKPGLHESTPDPLSTHATDDAVYSACGSTLHQAHADGWKQAYGIGYIDGSEQCVQAS
jgi:hypothetical protein